VSGKILNCRTLLRRNARERSSLALDQLRRHADEALGATAVESLLGIEGSAACTHSSGNMKSVTTAFAPRPRLWARADYDRLVAAGVFGPSDRVELIEGEIIEMSPEKSRHAAAVDLVLEALRRAFGGSYTIRVQHPLAVSEASEPEPDLAVVPGSARDYVDAHPSSAALVVEVSDTSLEYDRKRKARVYAEAGIADYWIVNVVEGILEVHRDPGASGYRSISRLETGENVSPVAAPGASIAVADLLP
jgi:Uma2 family endonuclease